MMRANSTLRIICLSLLVFIYSVAPVTTQAQEAVKGKSGEAVADKPVLMELLKAKQTKEKKRELPKTEEKPPEIKRPIVDSVVQRASVAANTRHPISSRRSYEKTPVGLRIRLPAIAAAQKSVAAQQNQPLQIGFGRALPTGYQGDLVPKLVWDKQDDDSLVGVLSLTSPGAKALRVSLRAKLPAGAEIRFFNPTDSKQRFPPLTRRDFSVDAVWSPIIEGDTLGVEISLPPAAKVSKRSVSIARVSHLSTAVAEPQNSRHIGRAASCHIDVACGTAPSNLNSIQSAVAKMTFTDAEGRSFLCTGNLMNDRVDGSFIPYFLTAYHCISTQSEASSLVTYWDFQRSNCRGASPTSVTQHTGGADLLAAHAASDSTLLRLRRNPPGTRTYSGWDPNALSHPTEVIGIHHPRGDLKKWNRGQTVRNRSYTLRGTGQLVSDAILIRWSQGTIEGGSSGSGLFDLSGHLRGIASSTPVDQLACGTTPQTSYGRFDQFYPHAQRWLAPTGPVDDHGDTRAQATRVGLNTNTNGNLEQAGDYDYFRLTVTQAGNLTVETSGSTDTYGSLLDTSGTQLAENDDGGSSTNFRIVRRVTAGTYYVAVRGFSGSTTGRYTLSVRFTIAIIDDHGNSRAQATRVGLNTSTNGNLEQARDIDYFRLTVARFGFLTVETDGTTDTYGFLLGTDGTQLAENDNGGIDPNFRISWEVRPGTYYVAVRGSSTSTTGPYRLRVRHLPVTTVALNTNTAGNLAQPREFDYFRLTVESPGTLTVETLGITDTYGFLLGTDGTQLAENDDGGSRINFRIVHRVTAGTYYVAVRGYSILTTGPYTLSVRFTPLTDDHGNTRARATRLALNTSTNGNLEQAGDLDYFRLLVTQTGNLGAETSGSTDTLGRLLSADGTPLEISDDDGSGNNFRIVRQVTAGIYYVEVRGYRLTTTGRYTLWVGGPPVTANLNDDGMVDSEDARILFYFFKFRSALRSNPSLRQNLLSQLAGGLSNDDAGYQQLLINAEAWATAGTGGDVNLDRRVDDKDALIMYYAYEFQAILETNASLRRLLLNGVRGDNLPDTDASYQQLLRNAQALR